MFRVIPDTNINFIGVRRVAFMLSSMLILLGAFAFFMIATGKANLGIDFAGGAVIQGHFEKPVAIEDLRHALSSEFEDIHVTEVTDYTYPNTFIIKTKGPETQAELDERVATLNRVLGERFADNVFDNSDTQDIIGPAVGESLRKDAQWAILISLLGIVLYIWIRFDFRSGVAATVATFHDVLAVLGICFILDLEFNLLIVTALLTLAGYSLTDTVVVFDRIRENLKKYRGKAEFIWAVNKSINEVLSRTFNTSLTVILVVGTLFLYGGDVLRNFSLALILGVLVGTYSSIFVASPIVVEWEARRPRRFK